MSTVAEQPNGKAIARQELTISYVPLGETTEIYLTMARTKQYLCVPTKSGMMPTDEQVMKYMMMCKAQSLNPWLNDAYLVGYDGKDGPQFSLITAHQSFLKRAEASPEFDGIESGVVVARGDEITERQGDMILNGETLVGGWARVHRRDRRIPSYDAINLKTFNTNRSRWLADPAGMIVKCAEASALRKAFPSTLAAMYCREEMDRERESHAVAAVTEQRPKTDRLVEQLKQRAIATDSAVAVPSQVLDQVMPESEPAAKTPQKASQRQPESHVGILLQRIEYATNNAMLEDIGNDAKDMMERGEMTSDEVKQIHDAIRQVGDLDK